MRKLLLVLIALFIILILIISPQGISAKPLSLPNLSTASDLVDAVNDIRASNGLPSYTPNSILMNIAQIHAEYMAENGVANTHVGAGGFLPYQRALQAGYPVAGDLSNGSPGFFSENVTGGIGKTPQEAVNEWMGDAPHRNTMLSADLFDVGAGVAVIGNTYYYCLDAGQSTGGVPRQFTPPPSYVPIQPTQIPNTPNADGSVSYIVQGGDTMLGIAIAYNISLDKLLALNSLTTKSVIYSGQKIIIRPAYTPTPTMPTLTPTGLPTITPWPTSTLISTNTPLPPTPYPSPALPVANARRMVFIIAGAALLISALAVLVGIKRK